MRILDEFAKMLKEIDRITRWFLLLFIILQFISGYAMVGKYGFEKILPQDFAAKLHLTLDIPTLILLFIHCFPSIYFIIKKWFE